jgi:hypothetical protein
MVSLVGKAQLTACKAPLENGDIAARVFLPGAA